MPLAQLLIKLAYMTVLSFSANNGDRKVKFSSFDGGEDGQYGGADFVEKLKILVMEDNFFH